MALHPSGGNWIPVGATVPVGARVAKSGGEGLYGRPLSFPVGEGLYGRSLGDCVARSFPLMEVDPFKFRRHEASWPFRTALYAFAIRVSERKGLSSNATRFPICPLSSNFARLKMALSSGVALIA